MGIVSSVMSMFLIFLTRVMASAIIDKLRKPKKSNLGKLIIPSRSPVYMLYWVIILFSPLGSNWTGEKSLMLPVGEITTPAAWTEIWRTLPSIFLAILIIVVTSRSFS